MNSVKREKSTPAVRSKKWLKMISTTTYTRAAKFTIPEIFDQIFTIEKQKELRARGVSYKDQEWIDLEFKKFEIKDQQGIKRVVTANMTSSRLLTFLRNGITCKKCGLNGAFFALERDIYQPQAKGDKYHLNLYASLEDGTEVLMTKDHILAKANGGKNALDNYQTMCVACNCEKGCKK